MSLNQMQQQDLIRKLGRTTWHFTPEAIAAFQDVGLPIPKGLTSFMLKVLSLKVIQEGEVQLTMMGLGLKIRKREYDIFVDLIEEAVD